MNGIQVSNGRHSFSCEETILACFDPKVDGDDYEPKPNADHVYISVFNLDQVDSLIKDSAASYIEEFIKTQPLEEKSFYAKDPFGNPICFVDDRTVFSG